MIYRYWLAASALLLTAGSALAGAANGNAGLVLAAIVGPKDPSLSTPDKVVLEEFLNESTKAKSKEPVIEVKADEIVCRVSNVAIVTHFCDLTFGNKKVHLAGRQGAELNAVMAWAGVPAEGAAGSVYESVKNFDCKVTVAEVEQNAGGGVTCSYQAQ
jgi:hypothetical protein